MINKNRTNFLKKNVIKTIEFRDNTLKLINNKKSNIVTNKELIHSQTQVMQKDIYVNDTTPMNKQEERIIRRNGLIPPVDLASNIQSKYRTYKLIPKRMFFYWSGGKLSWMRYMTIYSFVKMNPDWNVTLYVSDGLNQNKAWKDHNVQDYLTYVGIDYFNKIKELNINIEEAKFPDNIKDVLKNISPILLSDLFRYYQLFLGGGFYCDMDVIFFKPIDNIYNELILNGYDTIFHEYESTVDKNWWMTIGLLGSSINNDYYKDLFEFGINTINDVNDEYQSMGSWLIYKHLNVDRFSKIQDILKKKYYWLNFYNLPTSLVYAYDWTMIEYCFSKDFKINKFDISSIGYHWYGGKTISQKYNNLLNENNYTEHNIIFTHIVNKIMNEKPVEISIIMAYYNRKKLIYNTLRTISNSKFKDFELIVVDDCSSPEHRLEEYLEEFPFMKIIRLESKDKNYVNPCIPFNIGIRAASGNKIILQNPECLHVTDIISYVNDNLDDNNYITMSAYSIMEEQTSKISDNINNNTLFELINSLPQQPTGGSFVNGWYNHSVYRPTYYHFCAAISKSNMMKLNGFDERYSDGVGYDDNELIERVNRLGLIKSIEDNQSVIHQAHPTVFYNRIDISTLSGRNKLLFENVTMNENIITVNQN